MKTRSQTKDGRFQQRGGALLVAIVGTMVLAGLAGGMLAVAGALKGEHVAATENSKALYIAEAGLSSGIASVTAGAPVNSGSSADPVDFSGGGYWCMIVDNLDDTMTIASFGTRNGHTRGVEAVMRKNEEGVFASAVFAGNSSGDPLYDLKFGGLGGQADMVDGNVYSGGNVKITGDAQVTGAVKSTGVISGGVGKEGKSLPIPDMAGMHYETTADYDVASLFGAATLKANGLGGKAWELPETSPAHIFRKNPDDRSSDTSKTTKDDYFLEDPYETLNGSATLDWKNSTPITFSGIGSEPGVSSTNKVFYIDGNLWVHNRNAFSFAMISGDGTPLRVTLVVKGNIYISDNIFYQDADRDGLALIAIKDDAEKDSGNIYFGDPVFGTLEEMDAFMYAENDFLDNNLSATGSARVTVRGNMTAGNQVKINRDFGLEHSKLTVDFDDRLSAGDITLPGLPKATGAGASWVLASWREIPAP
ncbi:MAG TPA: hypothetical protein VK843_02655 [Planctomycetota bacterium]|nr:hypothetical protein [Planctomycetota bacterium]